ncbi:MAG TPA: hypothetical protein PKA28_12560 [Methylomusa anaerophila]|nr:hypothetical protein [Methylomusa anaerophila]HML89263.1 hypothetical protein [Methylomusa anaerophila]
MNKQGCCDAITRILKSNKARMALAAIILFSVTARPKKSTLPTRKN